MGLRKFFESTAGKTTAMALVVVGILAAIISLWINMSPNEAIADANSPVFIDAKSGQQKRLKLGSSKIPDGWYRAEACYWTKDGKVKDEPTYVLLNQFKGLKEPTFCPDCRRMVFPMNPAANSNNNPPPTEAEFQAKKGR